MRQSNERAKRGQRGEDLYFESRYHLHFLSLFQPYVNPKPTSHSPWMSSGSSLRVRSPAPAQGSNRRLPHPSASSPSRGRPTSTPRKLPFPSEPIDILPKSSSEPLLPGFSGGRSDSPTLVSDGWFYRQMTCTDLLSSSETLLSPERLQISNEVYQKDTKVVVTVTVEGSPGPIRTMVKLGTSVEEAIKLLIDKYDKEGRFPRLDKNAASIYELHLSYFSLASLDRSESIGEVGSRNFYLRKGKTTGLETKMIRVSSVVEDVGTNAGHVQARAWPWPSMVFLPAYVTRKTSKIVRRMRKLWKVLGCLHSSS